MGESTILKVTVNKEEIMLLEIVMKLEKKVGQHTIVFFSGILDPRKEGQENYIVPKAEIEIFDKGGLEVYEIDPQYRLQLYNPEYNDVPLPEKWRYSHFEPIAD